jgi:hypothetical protein
MGNMLFSQRVGDAVSGTADGDKDKHSEYRIFPEHMYKVINQKSYITVIFLFLAIFLKFHC